MPARPPRPALDDFTEGVRWGMFLLDFNKDDDPRADLWRERVLSEIVDQVDSTPDLPMRDLRPFIADAWDRAQGICHGTLKPGEICQDCGTINPGDEV
jgi:hypothetical protein